MTASQLTRFFISRRKATSTGALRRRRVKKTSATTMQAIVLIGEVMTLFSLAFVLTLWLRPN